MNHFTLTALPQPEDKEPTDPLTELLRAGARDLIAQAVEAELALMLEQHREHQLPDGRQAVVRNGYLPERTIQTGIGDVEIKVPKVRDRSGAGINFTSSLLPPYLKRTGSIEALLPWQERLIDVRQCGLDGTPTGTQPCHHRTYAGTPARTSLSIAMLTWG